MDKIRNLSVRKTIILYMSAALLCSFFLSAIIIEIAEQTQERIWWKYVDQETFMETVKNADPGYVVDIPRPGFYEMTPSDRFASELCDFLGMNAMLILSMAGNCAAVFLFYRNKLRKPLEELARGSKRLLRISWISAFPMTIRMRWANFAESLSGCGSSLPVIIRSYGERWRRKRCCGRRSLTIYALPCPF